MNAAIYNVVIIFCGFDGKISLHHRRRINVGLSVIRLKFIVSGSPV